MKPKTTPLLEQYIQFKEQNPEVLLLMRVGDFYEAFGEDAKILSNTLNIALTRKASGSKTYTELAGFPYHSLETYIGKLINANLKVAICEQLEEANGKTLIKRDISEILTPGIGHINTIAGNKNNNFLASIYCNKNTFGIAFLDVSTGEFVLGEGTKQYIDTLLNGYKPKEVIISKILKKDIEGLLNNKFYTTYLHDWIFEPNYANKILLKHFKNASIIKSFGVSNMVKGIVAAGACLHYLESLNYKDIHHITCINPINDLDYIYIDKFTIKNLEILEPLYRDGGKSLLSVIDKTITPMASRLLRNWITRPLVNINKINNRLDIVTFFHSNPRVADKLSLILKNIGDLDRIISKIALYKVKPSELIKFNYILIAIQDIKNLLDRNNFMSITDIAENLNPCIALKDKISSYLVDTSVETLEDNYIIAKGISKELDQLRQTKLTSNEVLTNIHNEQRRKSKIANLKLGFNNNLGYYFEITNKYKDQAPEDWIRKQSLVNAERYTIPELLEFGGKMLSIDTKIQAIENQIYADLITYAIGYIIKLQKNSGILAQLDVLLSFYSLSVQNHYVKPLLLNNKSGLIDIKNSRHPVIEKSLPSSEKYISNNLCLDNNNRIMIITGPNMGGKSSYLRQSALIILLAQIGCYVPASQATIDIVNKIFVRAGASDNLSQGESTFMVEMLEVAFILNNITDNSIVLLDEIGRGTSTYDGIAIAQAIVEYIAISSKAKVLFATHYHELQKLENNMPSIKNYNVSIKEVNEQILFLRKIERGASNKSCGINVAKLAGFPKEVVDRANDILTLIASETSPNSMTPLGPGGLLNSDGKYDYLLVLADKLSNMDINKMTPMDAFLFLQKEIESLKEVTSVNT